jgi:hypothetical protein
MKDFLARPREQIKNKSIAAWFLWISGRKAAPPGL